MTHYNYLCDLLEPLGIYSLSPSSVSGAELVAAGEALDMLAAKIALAEREGITQTAENTGLSLREKLFARCPIHFSVPARRRAIESLTQINDGCFTLDDINRTVSGCGIRAVVEETDTAGTVSVSFPDVAGIPESFDHIREIILSIIPCHLGVSFIFRFLTWAECHRIGYTWGNLQSAAHTWESWPKSVPSEGDDAA